MGVVHSFKGLLQAFTSIRSLTLELSGKRGRTPEINAFQTVHANRRLVTSALEICDWPPSCLHPRYASGTPSETSSKHGTKERRGSVSRALEYSTGPHPKNQARTKLQE